MPIIIVKISTHAISENLYSIADFLTPTQTNVEICKINVESGSSNIA